MKRCYFVISLLILTLYPPIIASKSSPKIQPTKIDINTCKVPGVNPEIFFPFGQKSDHIKLSCIRDNFSKAEIISQKLPIDRDNIYRYALSPMSLKDLLGDTLESVKPFLSLYLKEAVGDHDEVTPKILYFKQNTIVGFLPNSVIGVELCFENSQKTTSRLSRIALFFVQNITKKEDTEVPNKTGINHLTLYNADNNIHILSNFLNTENIIDTIFKKLITSYKEKIPNFLSKIIDNKVASIGKNQIGLIIETIGNEQKTVNGYKNTYGLNYIPLTDHNYLFYKNRTALHKTPAEYLIGSSKNRSIPINSNYHLYGTIVGYDEKDIEFKYQFEEYLRSINKINSDNTIAWPYDIKDHKDAFKKWVEKKWKSKSLINFFFTSHIDKKYQDDKKTTTIILKQMKDEYEKESLNVLKKVKNLPKDQHRKKIQNFFNTMRNIAEKSDVKGAEKLLAKIKDINQQKSPLYYRKHTIDLANTKIKSTPNPIQIEEHKEEKAYKPQGKKENEPIEKKQLNTEKVNISEDKTTIPPTKPVVVVEKEQEPEKKSWVSYLKNSANKATKLIEKATTPVTKYFVYTQPEEEKEEAKDSKNQLTIEPTTLITSPEPVVKPDIKKVNKTTQKSVSSALPSSNYDDINIDDEKGSWW